MEATKAKKRTRKNLTIEEKVEILDQIGKKSYKLLSEQYRVGISTISDTDTDTDFTSTKQLECIHMHSVITMLVIL